MISVFSHYTYCEVVSDALEDMEGVIALSDG